MKVSHFTVSAKSITLVDDDGNTHVVEKGSSNFQNLRQALLEDVDPTPYLSVTKGIEAWAYGDFTVEDEIVLYRGDPLPEELNTRVLRMATEGDDPLPVFRFWERLGRNPSKRSVEQLWRFLAHTGIPITSDGYFLAYKSVQNDFTDWYSGQVDNSPGANPKVPRNKVSDDPRTPCHEGLHVGSLGYAEFFGGNQKRVLVVKVDPEHVVCVPYDWDSGKMRVCEYISLGLMGSQLPDTLYVEEDLEPATQEFDDWDEDDEDWEDLNTQANAHEEPKGIEIQDDPQLPRWLLWDQADKQDLMLQNLGALRKYAAHHCKIVGASKIPGGKEALVVTLLARRG